jgi:hypothetical protein
LVFGEWPADEQGRADFAGIMDRMVETYGSDKNAKDISRVLRMPGFLNRKYDEAFQVRIHKVSGRRYARKELLEAFPPIAKRKPDPVPSITASTPDEARIRDALFIINADDRETWVRMGMAIKHVLGEGGRGLWDEWSATSDKFDRRDQERTWNSFKRNGVSAGTIFHEAALAGWRNSADERYDRLIEQLRTRPGPDQGKQPETANSGLGEQDFGEHTTVPPPRAWLLGTTFCRTFASSLLAAGGVGKTSLRYAQFLALASGRAITGEYVHQRSRVLVISLEDDDDELRRRMLAGMKYHGIAHEDVKGWLFTAAPGRSAGKLLEMNPTNRRVVLGQLAANIEAAILRRKPDLVSLDPFVKSHSVEENGNTAIDEVVQILTDLASKHDIAIDSPHHVSKGAADPGNADKGRGASAMVDAARLVKTLTPMSSEEAKRFGIKEEDRKQYVRVDNGKVNIAHGGGAPQWFEIIGVPLDNGTEFYPNGDVVQTMKPWHPPDTWADLSDALLNQILDKIDEGVPGGERYTDGRAAKDRAAWRVVAAMAPNKTEEQAKAIIRKWVDTGVLEHETYRSERERKDFQGLRVNATKRPGTVQG